MKRRSGLVILCGTLIALLVCFAAACRSEEETSGTPATPPVTPPTTSQGTPAPQTTAPAGENTAEPTPASSAAPTPETTPAGTDDPNATANPGTTVKPGATVKPGTTVRPGATAKPADPGSPAATAKPADPAGPGATARPSTVPIGTAQATAVPTAAPTATPAPQYPKPVFDTSTAKSGYVTIRYNKAQPVKYKVRLDLNGAYENYDLKGDGSVETFPVKLGTGTYQLMVLENISGTSYRIIAQTSFTVESASEFGPYLKPNPHVNYNDGMACISFAKSLVGGMGSDKEKARAIYSWVAGNIRYDSSLVGTLPAGYLPNPENTYNSRSGICYDHASLLAAMCRANGIPAKLIIGTADGIEGLHAWNNVYYDGGWHRMDPSAAAQGGGGSNYQVQKVY